MKYVTRNRWFRTDGSVVGIAFVSPLKTRTLWTLHVKWGKRSTAFGGFDGGSEGDIEAVYLRAIDLKLKWAGREDDLVLRERLIKALPQTLRYSGARIVQKVIYVLEREDHDESMGSTAENR